MYVTDTRPDVWAQYDAALNARVRDEIESALNELDECLFMALDEKLPVDERRAVWLAFNRLNEAVQQLPDPTA